MKLSEEKALYRAAAYCSKAERCGYDVVKKLQAWELTDEEQARIMKRLILGKFLDEERFCKYFINDKMKFNRWGRNKIIFELRKRRIPDKIYLPLLDELAPEEFEEQLIHILKVKEPSIKAKNDYEKKTKLIRFPLGRGFTMDSVIRCVDKLLGGSYEEYP